MTAILCALLLGTGCASTTYYIDAPEARRAITELQSNDEVVVQAVDEDGQDQVQIRLEADDEVEPVVSDDVASRWEESDDEFEIPDLRGHEDELLGFTFDHRNPGPGFLKWGVFLSCVGYGVPLQVALLAADARYLIPGAGPVFMAADAIAALEATDAAAHIILGGMFGLLGAMALATVQYTGTTLLILAAATWKRSRVVKLGAAPPRPPRFAVSLSPMADGGVSMGIGGRF